MKRLLLRAGFLRVGFPLLAKELAEQAAQRRTYIIRVLYALALFTAAYVMFADILGAPAESAFAVLGQGREMFDAIVTLQFFGLYLFVPAMASGCIALEKERNSLGTLLLTRLGPMTIVLEKYLSRLVPTFSFLLLSLPLLAFTYSLGGVTEGEFWGGVWILVLSAVQVGALAVMCSAFARTTAGAFIGAYVLGLFVYFLLPPCSGMSQFEIMRRAAGSGQPAGLTGYTVITLCSTGGFLLAARVFLVERAFLEPRNLLLEWFRGLDRFFNDLNQATGGIVLVRDDVTLPRDKPIAWRETQRQSLGTVRYLFRVVTAIETPLLALLVWFASGPTSERGTISTTLLYIVWVIAILLVCVKASGVISAERSRQTLDVLLTVPLSGAEILKQKASGLRRLVTVLCIPFFTIFTFEWSWVASLSGGHRDLLYIGGSALTVLIYLPLAGWLAMWLGIVIRSQTRAIIASLGLVFAWILLPVLLGVHQSAADIRGWAFVNGSSLVQMLAMWGSDRVVVAVNLGGHLVALAALRWFCLWQSDRLLGRLDTRGRPVAEDARESAEDAGDEGASIDAPISRQPLAW